MNPAFRLGIAGHVKLYRATEGRQGNTIQGMPVLLLSATGRKSGKERTVPLVFVEEDGGWVVAASYGGSPEHPAWFLNVRDNPKVKVQVGAHVFDCDAVIHDNGETRDTLWARLVEAGPFFAGYQKKTSRVIPVLHLRKV